MIFILTCVGFGLSLRIFERLYWENKIVKKLNWDYSWNAMWCIFVAMTTGLILLTIVGYGDFYACTHLGRFILIFGCIIGIYFVSMMMSNMTEKSVLKANEFKAFKLITRLNAKNEIKTINAKLIYHCLKMIQHKKKKIEENRSEKESELAESREKQHIYDLINDIKSYEKLFSTFDLSTQDHLYEISNRIDIDFKDLEKEIENLKEINNSLKLFIDSQIDIATNLKKTCYSTKMFYNILENVKIFDSLNNIDKNLKEIFEAEEENLSLINEKSIDLDNFHSKAAVRERGKSVRVRKTEAEINPNPNAPRRKGSSVHRREITVKQPAKIYNFGEDSVFFKVVRESQQRESTLSNNSSSDSDYDEDIYNYDIDPSMVKEHFSFLFSSKKKKSQGLPKNSKTMNIISRIKKKETTYIKSKIAK